MSSTFGRNGGLRGRQARGIGLPHAACAKAELRRCVANKERMPAETERKRGWSRIRDRQFLREHCSFTVAERAQRDGLRCEKRPWPGACALTLAVMVQREQRAAGIARADRPRTLPSEAVDRVGMVVEIAREFVDVAVEVKTCVGNAIRIRNEGIARVKANIACPGGRRTQHVDAGVSERQKSAADRGIDLDTCATGSKRDGVVHRSPRRTDAWT